MKHCPKCNRNFSDETLRFCLYDGELLEDAAAPTTTPPPLPQAPTTVPGPQAGPPPGQQYPYSPGVGQYTPQPPSGNGGGRRILTTLVIVIVGLFFVGRFMMGSARTDRRQVKNDPVRQQDSGLRRVSSGAQPARDEDRREDSTTRETRPDEQEDQPVVRRDDEQAEGREAERDNQADTEQGGDRAALVSTAQRAAAAETAAMLTLDPEPLRRVYTGEALQIVLSRLDQLRENEQIVAQKLEDQDFRSVAVSEDGQRAEINVVETWSAAVYSRREHRTVESVSKRAQPQTLHLERSGPDGGWMIRAITFESM